MKSTEGAIETNLSKISLTGYYVIGVVAITIGIFVVILLNLFTPLDSVRGRVLGESGALTWTVLFKFFLPRLLGLLLIAYIAVILGMNRVLRPIAGFLDLIRKNVEPEPSMTKKAQHRLLNLPFLFVIVNVCMWIVIPGLISLSMFLTLQADHHTVIILAARASMVGLIASAIAFHRIEAFSRQELIPLFFPDGRLIELKGAARISISRRIRLINRVGNTIPLTILVVTLLTLQWEVEMSPVSALEYGRGVLVFSLILFAYAFVSSGILNRLLSRNITQPLEEMIRVLRHVRRGEFNEKVRVVSNDEIGYTGDVINEMTSGLREREELRRSLELAREIQQNLLPRKNPEIPGLDIAGTSLYCDETGGDYYDFLEPGDSDTGDIRIVMGDVSGHGISSALLMATARAFLRQRSDMKGDLAQVVSDVNRQLSRDVMESANFMTLFYLEVDLSRKSLRWVRAGHDPAFFYNAKEDCFRELKGEGIAMGIDENRRYEEKMIAGLLAGDIVVLFTDGIWEAKNPAGEMFGKKTLCSVIQKNAALSAQQISDAVIQTLSSFQEGVKTEDDVTLIIVKIDGHHGRLKNLSK